jgi:hypothetical protein
MLPSTTTAESGEPSTVSSPVGVESSSESASSDSCAPSNAPRVSRSTFGALSSSTAPFHAACTAVSHNTMPSAVSDPTPVNSSADAPIVSTHYSAP